MNNIFAKGVPTYEIPNLKRSIIDMGMTNSLKNVSEFKVLSLNLGVTPQTCHKVLELSVNISLKTEKCRILPCRNFNRIGNKHAEYISSIWAKFMHLNFI